MLTRENVIANIQTDSALATFLEFIQASKDDPAKLNSLMGYCAEIKIAFDNRRLQAGEELADQIGVEPQKNVPSLDRMALFEVAGISAFSYFYPSSLVDRRDVGTLALLVGEGAIYSYQQLRHKRWKSQHDAAFPKFRVLDQQEQRLRMVTQLIGNYLQALNQPNVDEAGLEQDSLIAYIKDNHHFETVLNKIDVIEEIEELEKVDKQIDIIISQLQREAENNKRDIINRIGKPPEFITLKKVAAVGALAAVSGAYPCVMTAAGYTGTLLAIKALSQGVHGAMWGIVVSGAITLKQQAAWHEKMDHNQSMNEVKERYKRQKQRFHQVSAHLKACRLKINERRLAEHENDEPKQPQLRYRGRRNG